MRVRRERFRDRPHRARPRVDQLRRAVLLRREHRRAVGHLSVRQRGSVFDGEDALPSNLFRVTLDVERRRGEHDLRIRIARMDRLEHGVDSGLRRAVDLVDDTDVRHPQIRLARVVAKLVTGTVWIDNDDQEIGTDERRVVVASVPDDDVRFLLGRTEDALVVDAGEDEIALGDVGFVLLAFLDRRVGGFEILVALEALHRLRRQVAVRHRMTQHGDALARLAQERSHAARGLALARAGPNCSDCDDGLRRREHRLARRDQPVGRAGSQRARPDVHHVLVRHVRIGEHHFVDLVLADHFLERGLRQDRNSLRIQRPRQLGGVDAAVDVRDLRRGERDHVELRPVAVDEVEVVEVPSCCPCDQDPSPGHEYILFT